MQRLYGLRGTTSVEALETCISAGSAELQSFDDLVWGNLGSQTERDLYRLICRIRSLFRHSQISLFALLPLEVPFIGA